MFASLFVSRVESKRDAPPAGTEKNFAQILHFLAVCRVSGACKSFRFIAARWQSTCA
jgi:hypothetical protein